jgi:hypothetical protein
MPIVTIDYGRNSEATRMIHPVHADDDVLRTAAPVIQRGTTVLLDDYSEFGRTAPTYGRGGLLRRPRCDRRFANSKAARGLNFIRPG